jgi:hypothetical protein
MSTVASPTSVTRSPNASCTTPAGSSAPEPRASFAAGMPNNNSPPTPLPTASVAALRNESRVCCTTPGIDLIGAGSLRPSFTNKGNTRSDADTLVCATNRRSAGVRLKRRGRDTRFRRSASGLAPLGIGLLRLASRACPRATRLPCPLPVGLGSKSLRQPVGRKCVGKALHRRTLGEHVDP